MGDKMVARVLLTYLHTIPPHSKNHKNDIIIINSQKHKTMLTNIQLQDQIMQETGKSILELNLVELTNILHHINMSFVEQAEYENAQYEQDQLNDYYDYDDEYHYSANYTPLQMYEHEQWEERDGWENMMYARQEEITHYVSHINDNKLFSISAWPIEDEEQAFREIWKRRLSE